MRVLNGPQAYQLPLHVQSSSITLNRTNLRIIPTRSSGILQCSFAICKHSEIYPHPSPSSISRTRVCTHVDSTVPCHAKFSTLVRGLDLGFLQTIPATTEFHQGDAKLIPSYPMPLQSTQSLRLRRNRRPNKTIHPYEVVLKSHSSTTSPPPDLRGGRHRTLSSMDISTLGDKIQREEAELPAFSGWEEPNQTTLDSLDHAKSPGILRRSYSVTMPSRPLRRHRAHKDIRQVWETEGTTPQWPGDHV